MYEKASVATLLALWNANDHTSVADTEQSRPAPDRDLRQAFSPKHCVPALTLDALGSGC